MAKTFRAGAALIALVALASACTQILGFDEDYRVGGAAGGSGGAGGAPPIPCNDPTDCPGQEDTCGTRTCDGGFCGMDFAPEGTPLPDQTAWDCKQAVCDGQGGVVQQNDDADIMADMNECTGDACAGGNPTHPPLATGTPCGQGAATQCDGNGACVGCISASDCPADTTCTDWECTAGSCTTTFAPAGTACGAAASCTNAVYTDADACDDQGACVPGASQPCAPFGCNGSACGTTCAADSDCAPSSECNGADGLCVDCVTCAEWYQNPTPFGSGTNYCPGSFSIRSSFSNCTCSANCSNPCGNSELCGGGSTPSGSCNNCIQVLCSNTYNNCINDTYP